LRGAIGMSALCQKRTLGVSIRSPRRRARAASAARRGLFPSTPIRMAAFSVDRSYLPVRNRRDDRHL